jgi:hypothetical protein
MKFSIAMVTAALIVVALAQEKPKSSLPAETKQETTKSNPAGTKKSSADVIIGKVTDYTEGKSITVEKPKGLKKTRTFDLTGKDVTANVAPGISVGSTVKVVEKTDNDGHKVVTVQPYGKGSRAHAKTT